jgi:hypothetical protein
MGPEGNYPDALGRSGPARLTVFGDFRFWICDFRFPTLKF